MARVSAPRASRWRIDLCWVAAATLGCFLLAGALDLQESLTHRLARFETWEVDELPLSLLALACGLVWFALRRRRELQAQLELREQAEARIADWWFLDYDKSARSTVEVEESLQRSIAAVSERAARLGRRVPAPSCSAT